MDRSFAITSTLIEELVDSVSDQVRIKVLISQMPDYINKKILDEITMTSSNYFMPYDDKKDGNDTTTTTLDEEPVPAIPDTYMTRSVRC